MNPDNILKCTPALHYRSGLNGWEAQNRQRLDCVWAQEVVDSKPAVIIEQQNTKDLDMSPELQAMTSDAGRKSAYAAYLGDWTAVPPSRGLGNACQV